MSSTSTRRCFDLRVGEAVVCSADNWNAVIRVLEITPNGEVVLGIDGDGDIVVWLESGGKRKSKNMELSGVPKCKGLPWLLLLFSFILSPSTRRDFFYPAFNEFLEDYLFARKLYRTKWPRRWLALAFGIRSARLICKCFGLQLGSCLQSLFQAVVNAIFAWWSR